MKLVLFCLLLFNLLQQFSITTDLMNHSSEHMLAVFTHYCNDNGNEFVVIVFGPYTFLLCIRFGSESKSHGWLVVFATKRKKKYGGVKIFFEIL